MSSEGLLESLFSVCLEPCRFGEIWGSGRGGLPKLSFEAGPGCSRSAKNHRKRLPRLPLAGPDCILYAYFAVRVHVDFATLQPFAHFLYRGP